jgi:hypothetical protein
VPNHYFKPPKHIVDEWPEVFSDLYINTMPVDYLKSIHLEFSTGMVWELDVQEQLKNSDVEVVTQRLQETIQEYKHEVKKFDFKLDIDRLKKDIKKSTKLIL